MNKRFELVKISRGRYVIRDNEQCGIYQCTQRKEYVLSAKDDVTEIVDMMNHFCDVINEGLEPTELVFS